jgi:hypothetical protein
MEADREQHSREELQREGRYIYICVCVIERERECVCVCDRERECVCECECVRERVCVCV